MSGVESRDADQASARRLDRDAGQGQAASTPRRHSARALLAAGRVSAGALAGAAGLVSGTVSTAVSLLLAAGIGLCALTWRAGHAPLDLSWLAGPLAALVQSEEQRTRVAVAGATLSWDGWKAGPSAPVRLQLRDLRAAPADGVEQEVLGRLDAEYQPADLAAGRAQPVALEAERLRLRLARGADGTLRVLLPSVTASADGDEAAPAAASTRRTLRALLGPMERFSLRDAAIEVQDDATGQVWRLDDLSARLLRAGDDVSGEASATLGMAGMSASVRAEVNSAGPDGPTRVHAGVSPLQPTALARAIPQLAPLAALDAPLSAEVDAELDDLLRPIRARARVAAGAGTVTLHGKLAGPGPAPFQVALLQAAADATAEWDPAKPTSLRPTQAGLTEARVVLPSPTGAAPSTVAVSGRALRDAGRIRAELSVAVDRVGFADLPQLWPPGLAPGGRRWVTENITSGLVRDGQFQFGLDAAEDLSAVVLQSASGQATGDDAAVHWLRPVPPATGVDAHMRLLSPDVLEVGSLSGRWGALRVEDGTVRLTGLSGHDEAASIQLDIAGPLREVIRLLKHPRLHLLSHHPPPFEDPAGTGTVRVQVALPLRAHLEFDDVLVTADAQFSGVRLRKVAAGRDLEGGTLRLHATNTGMQVSGQAQVGGIPARLRTELDFRPGPPGQVLQHVEASGRAEPGQLGQFGLQFAAEHATGTAALDVVLDQRRNGSGEVAVQADLRDAAVATPFWAKPRGQAATVEGRLRLQGGELTGMDELRARGQDLLIDGRLAFQESHLRSLTLDRAVLGRTQGTLQVQFPDHPGQALRIHARGPTLDLAQQLAQRDAHRRAQPRRAAGRGAPSPYSVDVQFGRALLPGGGIVPLTLQAESDGRRLLRARLDAGSAAQGSIVPDNAGGRRLLLEVADLGLLLRTLDVTNSVAAGRLRLEGRFDDTKPGTPLAAEATVSDFRLFEAVVPGKILQAMTLYGVLDALRGPGLAFSRGVVPFTYASATGAFDDGVVSVRDARAFSASLGVTAQGWMDLGRKQVQMRGTVVPAYFFNSLPGRIPLIGRLFSPERGGGVLAAEYALRGKLDDPSVSVNPLATLTPGFLRGFFRLFD